jgi:anaerobilin synthase
MSSDQRKLPFKELPNLWNYLYPLFQDHPDPQQMATQFLHTATHYHPGKKALYVHIPFCDTICTFCPFIRSTNYADKLQPYVDALIQELKMVAATPYAQRFELNSIYFGGGTPSVLSPQMIEDLCTTINENFKLAADIEWSFEVEAKSGTEEKLRVMAANGVNRISFGVQTFDPEYRKIFNLTATMDDIQRTRDLADKYFKAFNMDLLYQLPGQTLERLQQDLDATIRLGTTSVDAYPLEYLVTSKGFLNMMKQDKIAMPPNANDKLVLQQFVTEHLLKNGYEQNYIYTFTRKNAVHNRFQFGESIYGNYEDEYIGCGQAAASSLCGVSYGNHVETKNYIEAVEAGLHPVQRGFEYHAKERGLIYLPKTMRMDLAYLNSLELDDSYHQKIQRFVDLGLLEKTDRELALTEEGKIWYMHMMIELLPADQRVIYEGYVERVKADRQWFENTELIEIE